MYAFAMYADALRTLHLRYTSGLNVSVTGREWKSWSATALNWHAPDL